MSSEELYERFMRVFTRMREERYIPVDAVGDLTPAETRMLVLIHRLQNEMVEVDHDVIAQIDKATPEMATAQLKALKDKGLVERRHRTEDFRAVYVVLTDEGLRLAIQAEQARRNRMKQMIEYLGEDDCTEFIRILDKVSAYYEDLASKGEAARALGEIEVDHALDGIDADRALDEAEAGQAKRV